jgi:prepilin-type N-terminal cleavage/methylation domain-containing protein
MSRQSGFTLREMLTAVVALVVIAVVTVAMWRSHSLRARRDDAVAALLAVQAAQDKFFGAHARYADGAAALGLKSASSRGLYEISIQPTADALGYWATARSTALQGERADPRCVELRIDQNGRRFAVDADGVDRSTDCWYVD